MMMIPGHKDHFITTRQRRAAFMLDFMEIQRYDKLFTIPEACVHFGVTKDELRSMCQQYGVELSKFNGQWGFPSVKFQRFNNTLYYEQCRDGEDDSRIWKETGTEQTKQQRMTGRNSTMLSYIKNIKGLKSTYTLEEVCALLGVTAEELQNLCDENDIPVYQDNDGTPILICYEYLTLNNRLYKKQCAAEGTACV